MNLYWEETDLNLLSFGHPKSSQTKTLVSLFWIGVYTFHIRLIWFIASFLHKGYIKLGGGEKGERVALVPNIICMYNVNICMYMEQKVVLVLVWPKLLQYLNKLWLHKNEGKL